MLTVKADRPCVRALPGGGRERAQLVGGEIDAVPAVADARGVSSSCQDCPGLSRLPAVQKRKNWLFAGSDAGGRRAAIQYSLIGTCRLVGVEPFEYLCDVLARIPNHPNRRLSDLTPRGWKAAQLVG
jgi:hypothetical protein